MIVFVDYIPLERYWCYYYYDAGNFKTKTEGFKTHILAEEHAKDKLGLDIKIKYKS